MYEGISNSSSVKTSNGQTGSLYINKVKGGYKLQLRFSNGNGVDLTPVAEIPIQTVSAAPASKKESGVVSGASISECKWIVGSWTGTIQNEKESRTLEIFLTNEGKAMKAMYGITGKGMSYLNIDISGEKIFFITGSKSKVNLNKVSESQMIGTFENSSGRVTEAVFKKNL